MAVIAPQKKSGKHSKLYYMYICAITLATVSLSLQLFLLTFHSFTSWPDEMAPTSDQDALTAPSKLVPSNRPTTFLRSSSTPKARNPSCKLSGSTLVIVSRRTSDVKLIKDITQSVLQGCPEANIHHLVDTSLGKEDMNTLLGQQSMLPGYHLELMREKPLKKTPCAYVPSIVADNIFKAVTDTQKANRSAMVLLVDPGHYLLDVLPVFAQTHTSFVAVNVDVTSVGLAQKPAFCRAISHASQIFEMPDYNIHCLASSHTRQCEPPSLAAFCHENHIETVKLGKGVAFDESLPDVHTSIDYSLPSVAAWYKKEAASRRLQEAEETPGKELTLSTASHVVPAPKVESNSLWGPGRCTHNNTGAECLNVETCSSSAQRKALVMSHDLHVSIKLDKFTDRGVKRIRECMESFARAAKTLDADAILLIPSDELRENELSAEVQKQFDDWGIVIVKVPWIIPPGASADVAKEVPGTCGPREFMKLQALALHEHTKVPYDSVVFFDADLFLRTLEGRKLHLLNKVFDCAASGFFLTARSFHHSVNGGFFAARPSRPLLDDMIKKLSVARVDEYTGWNHFGWGPPKRGERSVDFRVQGFFYHYLYQRTDGKTNARQIDPCVFDATNNLVKRGMCDAEICSDQTIAYHDTPVVHCKPKTGAWRCHGGDRDCLDLSTCTKRASKKVLVAAHDLNVPFELDGKPIGNKAKWVKSNESISLYSMRSVLQSWKKLSELDGADIVMLVPETAKNQIPDSAAHFLADLGVKIVKTTWVIPNISATLPRKGGCCGPAEFMKLNFLGLEEYDAAVLLDTDIWIPTGKSLDPIWNCAASGHFLTARSSRYAVNGGFMAARPNKDNLNAMLDVLSKSTADPHTGWDGKGWGAPKKGMISDDFRMQGFLYYYFAQRGPHATVTWSQVDPCIWNVGEHLKEQCQYELCSGQTVLYHGVVHGCVRSKLPIASSPTVSALPAVMSEVADTVGDATSSSSYEVNIRSGNCGCLNAARDIHVVYGASVEVLDLLKASVSSVAVNVADPCRVQVHIFLPSKDLATMRRALVSDQFPPYCGLRRVALALHAIDFNTSSCIPGLVPKFNKNKRLETPMNHIRADLDCFFKDSAAAGGGGGLSLPFEGQSIIYIDVDTIVQTDLGKELRDFELSGKPAGVALYPSGHAKRFVGNHTAIKASAIESLSNPAFNYYSTELARVLESEAFNAGVMFINMKAWSANKLTQKYKYFVQLQSSSEQQMFQSGNQIYLQMTLTGSRDSMLHILRPTMNTVLHASSEKSCRDWLAKYGFLPTYSSARNAGILHWAGSGKPCVATKGPCPSHCLGALWRNYHSEYQKWFATVAEPVSEVQNINCPLGNTTMILISRSYISYLSGHSIYSWQLATVLLRHCPHVHIIHVMNSDESPDNSAICPEIQNPRYRLVKTVGCTAEADTDPALRQSSIAATLRSVLEEGVKNPVGFIINTLMFLQDVTPVFAEYGVPVMASLRGTDLYIVQEAQQNRYHQALQQLKHIFTMSPYMRKFGESYGLTVGEELPTLVNDIDSPKLMQFFSQWADQHKMDLDSTLPLLIYVGRLSREKGVVRIAKVFASIARSISVQIIMGGSGPEEAEVQHELANTSSAIVAPLSYLEVRALAAHARARRSIFVSEPGVDTNFVEGLGSAYMFFSAEGVPLLFPVKKAGGAKYTCSVENARWAEQFPVEDFEKTIKQYIAGDFDELNLSRANLIHAAQHWSNGRVLAPLFKEVDKFNQDDIRFYDGASVRQERVNELMI